MIGEVQRELDGISHRLTDLATASPIGIAALRDIERAQKELRSSLDADRATIESQLTDARKRRDERAAHVPRRCSRATIAFARRSEARRLSTSWKLSARIVIAVIPLQRRSAMVGSGVTEICEGCGVLLYAGE
jgi:hypothetical protein